MADLQASGGNVLSAISSTAQEIQTSGLNILAAYNFPTEFIKVPTANVTSAIQAHNPMRVSGSNILAVGKGRVSNPKLRAWTYTLDGHDFYVLRLGDDTTFVYDLTTKQWTRFTSGSLEFWRPSVGMVWRDAKSLSHTYGSSVVVGDDTFGLLWFLDPRQGYDDHPLKSNTEPKRFPRAATGQMIARGRDYISCYSVYLTASGGYPSLANSVVELKYSDDAGNTYVSAGEQPVTAGDYNQDLDWFSLGSYTYPGRIYRIEDDGALARIDGLDINLASATNN